MRDFRDRLEQTNHSLIAKVTEVYETARGTLTYEEAMNIVFVHLKIK